MKTISKKCIVFKNNGNDTKVINLELMEYHGMFVREVEYIPNLKQFEVFLEYKNYCVKVDLLNLDLEKYKKEFDSVCLDKINALRKMFPNNCILELLKLTNENELYKEFFENRNSILAKREKRNKEIEEERDKIEKLQKECAKKEHEQLIKMAINKWKNKEEISNIEFLELCKLNNINIHPKTLHFIQVSLVSVSENRRNFIFKKQFNSKGKIYTPKCNNFCNVLDELNAKTI